MIGIAIALNAEGSLEDWKDRPQQELEKRELIRIGCLPHGCVSGAPAVSIAIPLADGSVVFAQTSLSMFLAVADAFRAEYADAPTGPGITILSPAGDA